MLWIERVDQALLIIVADLNTILKGSVGADQRQRGSAVDPSPSCLGHVEQFEGHHESPGAFACVLGHALANDRRQRRLFSAADKLRILDEADGWNGRGEIGELLRREGIYSSHLSLRNCLRA